MAAGYDNVSVFYDKLSKLVFGKAQLEAQAFFLPSILPGSKIVIAGGGTGWILEAVAKMYPTGLNITFIDASQNMINLAKKRDAAENKVTFIAKPLQEIDLPEESFNVVFTPFFFDNFTDETSAQLFNILDKSLIKNGLWLQTDFAAPRKWWQKLLLATMYLFFRLLCKVEAQHLPDVETLFHESNYQMKQDRYFYSGFIRSALFQKHLTEKQFQMEKHK